MKIILTSFLFILFSINLNASEPYKTICHNDLDRKYLIECPKQLKADSLYPVIFAFHGGGGNAIQLKNFWKLHRLATAQQFIVVYPEAADGFWRIDPVNNKMNDAGFIRALGDSLARCFPVDLNHLYATGVSNGGMFCFRLALADSDLLKGIAVISANLPTTLARNERLKQGIPLLIINGTDDPVMPYEGGPIRVNLFPKLNKLLHRTPKSRGIVLSVDETIRWWLTGWHIELAKDSVELTDKDPDDGCTVMRRTWNHSDGKTCLSQYQINGGGHSIPSGRQTLSERIIGNTCRDFDERTVILDFFKQFQ